MAFNFIHPALHEWMDICVNGVYSFIFIFVKSFYTQLEINVRKIKVVIKFKFFFKITQKKIIYHWEAIYVRIFHSRNADGIGCGWWWLSEKNEKLQNHSFHLAIIDFDLLNLTIFFWNRAKNIVIKWARWQHSAWCKFNAKCLIIEHFLHSHRFEFLVVVWL